MVSLAKYDHLSQDSMLFFSHIMCKHLKAIRGITEGNKWGRVVVLEGSVINTEAAAIAVSIMTCLPYQVVGFTLAFFENHSWNGNESVFLQGLWNNPLPYALKRLSEFHEIHSLSLQEKRGCHWALRQKCWVPQPSLCPLLPVFQLCWWGRVHLWHPFSVETFLIVLYVLCYVQFLLCPGPPHPISTIELCPTLFFPGYLSLFFCCLGICFFHFSLTSSSLLSNTDLSAFLTWFPGPGGLVTPVLYGVLP